MTHAKSGRGLTVSGYLFIACGVMFLLIVIASSIQKGALTIAYVAPGLVFLGLGLYLVITARRFGAQITDDSSKEPDV